MKVPHDEFGEWLDKTVSRSTLGAVPVGQLYRSWTMFCAQGGYSTGTPKRFSQELISRGFKRGRVSGGVRAFKGIQMK